MDLDGVESQDYSSYQALKDEIRSLKDENQSLRARLEEAEELQRAISEGDLDALVIPGSAGEMIFTLDSADRAYRTLVETMNEGTATLGFDGTILYCNQRFAELLKMPVQAIIGTSIYRFIAHEDTPVFKSLLEHNMNSAEVKLQDVKRKYLPVYISISSLKTEHSPNAWCLVVTDLTEQKKNEEIVASERLARSIIEQCTEAIVVCDTSGKIIRRSESAIDLLGFLSLFQQFENLVNLRLTYGDDTGESIFPVSSALEGSTIKGLEVSFESKSHKLSMLLNSTPLRNATGDIIGCVLTPTDTTEIKQNEAELHRAYENLQIQSEELQSQSKEIQVQNEELQAQSEELHKTYDAVKESEERFRSVLDSSIDTIYRFNIQTGHYEYLSPSVEDAVGFSQDELMALDAMISLEIVHPDDRRALLIAISQLEEKDKVEAVYRQRMKSGEYRWISNYIFLTRDNSGKPLYRSGSIRDITERKQVEEALKQAYETLEDKVKERTEELEKTCMSLKESKQSFSEAQKMAHIGSWEWNIATNKLFWSDEIYNIFGLTPQELDLTLDIFLNFVHPEDREYVENTIIGILQKKPFDIDYRIILSDGSEKIVEAQGRAVFDEKNNPIIIRGMIQDITERSRAEKAVKKLNQIRIKEIHHRIKNNLQVISSILDLQAERFTDKNVLDAFKESQNRVISMALIHEELYKGEETDKVNFSDYTEKLAEKLFQAYKFHNKNIHLSMDLEENTFFDMDIAIPLGIIINELVSNSLKHAFNGGKEKGEICIQLYKEEESSNVTNEHIFNLTVSDNGDGFPKELEVENAESLGLQLVNILVDQLDGKLELRRDNSTEFKIRFAVTEDNEQPLLPALQQNM